ncbi:MAG: acyl-CoA thioesterase [Gemmatimonadota bacterium]
MSEPVRISVQVRYAETDQQGVAYHSHYLVWMEIGRTAFLDAVGFPYRQIEAEGVAFSVVAARVRYGGAARYGETVEVITRCRSVRSREVVFDYTLQVGARPIAQGETTLIALDGDRRPCRIPAPVVEALLNRAGGPAIYERSNPGRSQPAA